MSQHRKARRFERKVAAERGPEDGMDPKDFFRPAVRQNGRKAMQLCGQIREALYWVLGSETGDESLALLHVLSVEPLGNSAQILVVLGAPNDVDLDEMSEKVHAAAKAIRSEIAASIHRRKVPELFFRVVHS